MSAGAHESAAFSEHTEQLHWSTGAAVPPESGSLDSSRLQSAVVDWCMAALRKLETAYNQGC